jgi:hypothetical protein
MRYHTTLSGIDCNLPRSPQILPLTAQVDSLLFDSCYNALSCLTCTSAVLRLDVQFPWFDDGSPLLQRKFSHQAPHTVAYLTSYFSEKEDEVTAATADAEIIERQAQPMPTHLFAIVAEAEQL